MIYLNLKKCEVRTLKLEDAKSIATNGNNPKIAAKMRDVFPSPYRVETAQAWINMNLLPANKDWVNAIIVNGEAVGVASILFKTDIYQHSAEVGYWIGEDYWGKGIVSEAVKALVDYTLENTDVTRLYAEVFDNNKASAKVVQKAGLVYECTHQKSIIKNGEIMDSHIYTIIR